MRFSRYLLRQLLAFFILVYLSAVAVFVLIDFVGNIETWLNKPIQDTLRYYYYYLPQISYLIMPIIILLTSTIVIGQLARHLEIAAMKSAGQSVLKLVMPIILFALCISGAMFYLSDQILPDANHKRLQIAQPKTKNTERNKREEEKYQFVFVGLSESNYYFQHYSAKTRMGEQVSFFLMNQGLMTKRWDAATAEYRTGKWLLKKVQFRDLSTHPQTFYQRDSIFLDPKLFPESPTDLLDTRFKSDEMTLAHMKRKITLLLHAGEDTKELETQWHFRISSAFISLFIALFGLSLSHGVIRGGLAHGIMLGLGFSFLYYLGLRLGITLGVNGTCSPWLAAWLGNILFGSFSLIQFWRSIRL